MRATIIGVPNYRISLSQQELDLLKKLSSEHYDAKCISAGKPGGFLETWNRMLVTHGFETVDATTRELDTCCKILEQLFYGRQRNEMADKLRLQLSSLLHVAFEAAGSWRVEVQ